MKKLEKYKIAPQVKFVKFKVKHFVKILTIHHDKAVPPDHRGGGHYVYVTKGNR